MTTIMKKAYLFLLGFLALAGCEKQLDIVPKGQTTSSIWNICLTRTTAWVRPTILKFSVTS